MPSSPAAGIVPSLPAKSETLVRLEKVYANMLARHRQRGADGYAAFGATQGGKNGLLPAATDNRSYHSHNA